VKNIIVMIIILLPLNYHLANTKNLSSFVAEKVDTLNIFTIRYADSLPDSLVYINIDYPQIKGFENKLIENKVNSFLETEFKQSISWYDDIIKDTSEFTSDIHRYPWSFETGFEVHYNSNDFLSLTLDHYQFTGGAHGNYFSVGYNINLRDGKNLKLSDLIDSDSFDLLSYECEQGILDTFQVGSLTEAGLFEDEIIIHPDQDFYIIPGALVLQFDPYEIGPYSMGDINIKIPFYNIKDILKSNLPFLTN
jgi:hypothetical protein